MSEVRSSKSEVISSSNRLLKNSTIVIANVNGNVVWNYNRGGQIVRALRYAPDYPGLKNLPTAVAEEKSELPENFALMQNYPNPFNPSTKITYRLPISSEVKLTVFDVHGREVTTLLQAKQPAGTHEAVFDASGLSNGIYYYKLTAGNFSATKEMLLIK
jgi:hypothetical protein